MAKFRNVPLGACFRLGKSKAVHHKNGTDTYLDDMVGGEVTLDGGANVRILKSCPRVKVLIELGSARKKK